ncbi:hypothetical protein B5S29_g4687 [[Candida] boidinii]|nr:hypothetical protein B5S29_g4687 [[Candida] boidinii]
MSDQNLVNSVAFTSFTVVNTKSYIELVEFYKKFGFQVVRSYTKDLVTIDRNVQGISTDSRRECWLNCFSISRINPSTNSIIPFQETPEYTNNSKNLDNLNNYNNGVMLKIRLLSHDVHKNTELPGQLIFFTSDLKRVKEIVNENNFKIIDSSSDELNKIELMIQDPVGNIIGFTNYPTGISNLKIENSKEFFESPQELLNNENLDNDTKLIIKDALLKSKSQIDNSNLTQLKETSNPKKKIAVMTSGGDSPGMCAAVRAVVRAGIFFGCDVYGCYEGYSGLVQGGDLLKKMEWETVRGWLSLGGTLIGTARCKEFRERWGRLKAAKNMILNGIDALVVCGGDGSLTGADLFRSEWPSLLKELVETNELTNDQVEKYKHLTIVGLVGSIDNDMASTDSTIGASSSLERICEMVDYIDSTASSHSRAFVVEVMGRHCGWLALMSGISCGADFIFIPERPPSALNWKDELKEVCLRHRFKGRRKTTVIVAEGALDDQLNPITSEQVKDCLVEIGLDTRITTLGHVQRGGTASAFDRLLATLQGVEAVKAVLESTPETPSPMIGISENKIVRRELVKAVELTKSVATAIENKEFDKAMNLRDTAFIESFDNFMSVSKNDDDSQLLPVEERLNIGIIHVGAPTAALNAATRAAALYCLSKGHTAYGIQNGFSGLIRHGSLKKLEWLDVEEWHNLGGSELGTNRTLPSSDLGSVAYYFQLYKLQGLIIIGGFEAYHALNELSEARNDYPIFNMPMTCLPATVSNNVPGTEYSLGSDTCLNVLVNYCDAVKQSASASRRRVFVVEVQGGNSGFIASYIGLVTGSLAVYTPEDKINLRSLQEDIELLKDNFASDIGANRSGKMFIRNENASEVYTTELIADIIKEAGKGKFESRTAVPGHVQQGRQPSSMDRCYAVRFAIKCCEFIENWNKNVRDEVKVINKEGFGANEESFKLFNIKPEEELRFVYKHGVKYPLSNDKPIDQSAAVVGIHGSAVCFESISDLWSNETNFELRKGNSVHWSVMNDVNGILSGRMLLRQKKTNNNN